MKLWINIDQNVNVETCVKKMALARKMVDSYITATVDHAQKQKKDLVILD